MCNIRNCKNSKLPPSACLARRAAPKRNRKEVCLSLQTVNVGGAPRTTPCTSQNRGWVKPIGFGRRGSRKALHKALRKLSTRAPTRAPTLGAIGGCASTRSLDNMQSIIRIEQSFPTTGMAAVPTRRLPRSLGPTGASSSRADAPAPGLPQQHSLALHLILWRLSDGSTIGCLLSVHVHLQ